MVLRMGAVGDDPKSRLGLAEGTDGGRSDELLVDAGRASPAEVDDHHVEVADRGQELEGARAGVRLLDLVAVCERLAHAQPHGGLGIYDKAASIVVHGSTPTASSVPTSTAFLGVNYSTSRRRPREHPSGGRRPRDDAARKERPFWLRPFHPIQQPG